MLRQILSSIALMFVLAGVSGAQTPAPAVDVTGKWTASFETQIGVQNYTYEFQVKEKVLTGKASSDNGSSEIKDGKVEGSVVGEFATEELVAKRVK